MLPSNAHAVTQDLHLAKRFYDKAVATAPDAWLPVRCALAGLPAHAAWLRLAPRLPRQLVWLRRHVFAGPTQPGAARASVLVPSPQPAATPRVFIAACSMDWSGGSASGVDVKVC